MQRVNNLIAIHNEGLKGRTIDPSRKQDLLRSAVVFMHASIEDLLRELLRWQSPTEKREFLQLLRFDVGSARKERISVEELAAFRTLSVEELLEQSIAAHLQRRSFNDTNEVVDALTLIGVRKTTYENALPDLSKMIKRRHKIVHNGDRIDLDADTHGKPLPISDVEVSRWKRNVTAFGEALLTELTPKKRRLKISKKSRSV
jgi:hypothetical protein